MMKEYTSDDCLSVSELKAMPIGTTIDGQDTYNSAIKTDADLWTFDDRIETFFEKTSYFIAKVFEDTDFIVNTP